MQIQGLLPKLPKEIRRLIALFTVVVSCGFLTAVQFVDLTTSGTPQGIQENYLGNEDDLEAEEMKFEKSEREMLNIIHAHMLSLGLLFFVLALLVSTTPVSGIFRKILLIEPLLSVLATFGGMYLLWKGILWMKYVVMLSGMLMTLSWIASVILILYWCFKVNLNE